VANAAEGQELLFLRGQDDQKEDHQKYQGANHSGDHELQRRNQKEDETWAAAKLFSLRCQLRPETQYAPFRVLARPFVSSSSMEREIFPLDHRQKLFCIEAEVD